MDSKQNLGSIYVMDRHQVVEMLKQWAIVNEIDADTIEIDTYGTPYVTVQLRQPNE